MPGEKIAVTLKQKFFRTFAMVSANNGILILLSLATLLETQASTKNAGLSTIVIIATISDVETFCRA